MVSFSGTTNMNIVFQVRDSAHIRLAEPLGCNSPLLNECSELLSFFFFKKKRLEIQQYFLICSRCDTYQIAVKPLDHSDSYIKPRDLLLVLHKCLITANQDHCSLALCNGSGDGWRQSVYQLGEPKSFCFPWMTLLQKSRVTLTLPYVKRRGWRGPGGRRTTSTRFL
jgi:hypothetical protein